jgi:hypothetical protein
LGDCRCASPRWSCCAPSQICVCLGHSATIAYRNVGDLRGLLRAYRIGCAVSALLELAERCEQAAGPDEVLDGAIEAACKIAFGVDVTMFNEGVPIEWESDDDDGRVVVLIGGHKFKAYRAPAFTASLDAAMTLVPEGKGFVVSSVGPSANRPYALVGDPTAETDESKGASAATPALALCAAALRARAASCDRNPTGQDREAGLGAEHESAVGSEAGETPKQGRP